MAVPDGDAASQHADTNMGDMAGLADISLGLDKNRIRRVRARYFFYESYSPFKSALLTYPPAAQ